MELPVFKVEFPGEGQFIAAGVVDDQEELVPGGGGLPDEGEDLSGSLRVQPGGELVQDHHRRLLQPEPELEQEELLALSHGEGAAVVPDGPPVLREPRLPEERPGLLVLQGMPGDEGEVVLKGLVEEPLVLTDREDLPLQRLLPVAGEGDAVEEDQVVTLRLGGISWPVK